MTAEELNVSLDFTYVLGYPFLPCFTRPSFYCLRTNKQDNYDDDKVLYRT